MADLRIILIGFTVVAFSSAASYFAYPGYYPVVFFQDFMYLPTDYGYMLLYRTDNGVTHHEQGIVPDVPFRDDESNRYTIGSPKEGRVKSKIPLKNRKVSPKLLASLSG